MADHLTLLQDGLDKFAVQMFASLRYLSSHHASSRIEGQPYHGFESGVDYPRRSDSIGGLPVDASPIEPKPGSPETGREGTGDREIYEQLPRPESPGTFTAALQEMSKDLVELEQNIEGLIKTLPGTNRTKAEQEQKISELNAALEEADTGLKRAAEQKEELLDRIEKAIWKIKRP